MKMNSEYEELIEEHCENCYYYKNGNCYIARYDRVCEIREQLEEQEKDEEE